MLAPHALTGLYETSTVLDESMLENVVKAKLLVQRVFDPRSTRDHAPSGSPFEGTVEAPNALHRAGPSYGVRERAAFDTHDLVRHLPR
jgi:hypothetical protein